MFYLITKFKFQDTWGGRERARNATVEIIGPMMDVDIGSEVILFIILFLKFLFFVFNQNEIHRWFYTCYRWGIIETTWGILHHMILVL